MLFERPSIHHENWIGHMKNNRRTQSFQPDSFSTLGPAAYHRVQEWSRKNFPGQNLPLDGERTNERSFSEGGWREPGYRHYSSQSLAFNPEFEDNDDVTPWDSVSMTSSRNEPISQRDSNTYDYIDDELVQQQNYRHTNRRDCQERGYFRVKSSRSAPNLRKLASRGAAMNRFNSLNVQGDHSDKESNNKLLSCIDSLDYLSQKLEKVTQVSSEIGKFRSASQSLAPEDLERPMSSRNPRDNARVKDWRIGDDMASRRSEEKRHRQRSYDSASSDSGVNFNGEYIPGQFEKSSNFSPQNMSRNQGYPPIPYKPNTYKNRLSQQSHARNEQIEENSSGYFSECNSVQNPQYKSGAYLTQRDPHKSNGVGTYPYPTQGHESWYDFEGVYGAEDLYGYGTYGYASSSVYDEDLRHNDGWFYLPSYQQSSPSSYPAPTLPQQKSTTHVQQSLYAPNSLNYPANMQPTQNADATAISYQQQQWPGTGYGSLSGSFLNPTEVISPLGAAITASCAKDYFANETNEFGVPQNYNASFPPVENLDSGEGKKRKSVRFSQTVQERIEKNESEVEDKTSFMKGADNELNTKMPDHCDVDTLPQFSSSTFSAVADEQPVYSFPTGNNAPQW